MPSIESTASCSHIVYPSGVRMEDIVEIKLIVVPFRPFLYHMIMPSFEERNILKLGTIPRSGVFGKAFKYEQCSDESTAQCGGINPESVPVGASSGDGIRTFIYRDYCLISFDCASVNAVDRNAIRLQDCTVAMQRQSEAQ